MSMSMSSVVGYSYARRDTVNGVERAMEGDGHVQPDINIVQANARMPEWQGILLSESEVSIASRHFLEYH